MDSESLTKHPTSSQVANLPVMSTRVDQYTAFLRICQVPQHTLQYHVAPKTTYIILFLIISWHCSKEESLPDLRFVMAFQISKFCRAFTRIVYPSRTLSTLTGPYSVGKVR